MKTALSPAADTVDLRLAEDDFEALAALVHRVSGIALGPAKRGLVVARLARRLRALGMAGFAEYRAHVCSPGGAAEQAHLISALTTNVTRFFREQHHFDVLGQEILPPLITRARAGGRVRLWSAGCSTGEEPYSIALMLHDLCPEAGRLDIRILATDIDAQVLARAATARYDGTALEGIPPALRRAGLEPGAGPAGFTIAPDVRRLIRFAPLNLIARWPMQDGFDAVFCRNVVIYFDTHTQARLWSRLAARIHAGGALFIGHSERVGPEGAPYFEPAGTTRYRRTAIPAPNGAEP
ncbi:MAG: protein-glutamate O-methyltransferase [Rhodobacteraceae bacterium]|nr:protein-glutamate O-methyltransferase [Paracoccaceae bacterium]